jgi:hypothetical protein
MSPQQTSMRANLPRRTRLFRERSPLAAVLAARVRRRRKGRPPNVGDRLLNIRAAENPLSACLEGSAPIAWATMSSPCSKRSGQKAAHKLAHHGRLSVVAASSITLAALCSVASRRVQIRPSVFAPLR